MIIQCKTTEFIKQIFLVSNISYLKVPVNSFFRGSVYISFGEYFKFWYESSAGPDVEKGIVELLCGCFGLFLYFDMQSRKKIWSYIHPHNSYIKISISWYSCSCKYQNVVSRNNIRYAIYIYVCCSHCKFYKPCWTVE